MANQTGALRFTVEERVLLHLLDYITARSKIEVPQSITQEGISQIIHIHRKHLPRCLKIMKEKTLIQEKTTHVIGKTQRMKTYYLTLTGEARACELRDCILNCTIQIRDTHNCLKKKRLKRLKTLFRDYKALPKSFLV